MGKALVALDWGFPHFHEAFLVKGVTKKRCRAAHDIRTEQFVIPENAGIQSFQEILDSRLRGSDVLVASLSNPGQLQMIAAL